MTQDEQIREKIAKDEFKLVLNLAYEHEFTMTAYTWEELELKFKEYYYYRADQILSQTVSRGGGVCPECLGQKRLSDKQGMKADCSYGFIDWCLACNGTGQKQPKTLGEIIKGWEDETEE